VLQEAMKGGFILLAITKQKYRKPMSEHELNFPNQLESRRSFFKKLGSALMTGGLFTAAGWATRVQAHDVTNNNQLGPLPSPGAAKTNRVAKDPTDIPGPIKRRTPKTHHITLEAKEVVAEIEPGVQFKFMTFNGTVPGPMLRVRQGDTVNLTLKNNSKNQAIHNVDMHCVYGTGGGAKATFCPPGGSASFTFQAQYPGAFIYHCAVPKLDYHISSGMYGMIVVEPPEGLPEVDREFYFGQNEIYTDKPGGENGHHRFNFDSMKAENPSYVLLNGGKQAISEKRYGAVQAKTGETARVFMVTGGPNLTSSFHPIGNVWTKAWREGAVLSQPERYVQTCQVAPGSCGVFEMEFPVPEDVFLVDHALTRFASKGTLGVIHVEGPEKPNLFNANPK